MHALHYAHVASNHSAAPATNRPEHTYASTCTCKPPACICLRSSGALCLPRAAGAAPGNDRPLCPSADGGCCMAHAWLLCVIGSRQRPPRHAMPSVRTGMNHLRACHGLPAPCRACHRLGGSAIAARSQGRAGRTARGHLFCLRVQPLLEILDFRDRGERITQIMQACKWRLDTLYPSIHPM